jgi:hypothetical protein
MPLYLCGLFLCLCVVSGATAQNNKLRTYLYKGKVANLDIRLTLVFNEANPCDFVQGSYYYTNHHPEQIYLLEGTCGQQACHPMEYNKAIIKQGLKLREYTGSKHTANLFLCTASAGRLYELNGTMTNTDKQGKTFKVSLELINVSR